MTVFDLDNVHLITDRPGATPAPAHTAAGDPPTRPGDGPWKPGGPSVTEKACGCGVLDGEECDCAEFAAQLEDHLTRPIWLGRPENPRSSDWEICPTCGRPARRIVGNTYKCPNNHRFTRKQRRAA